MKSKTRKASRATAVRSKGRRNKPDTGKARKDSSLDAAFDDLFGSGPLEFLANCAEGAKRNRCKAKAK